MVKTDIGDGKWLDAPAAASYARMRAVGMPPGITSAGRDAAEQQRLRDLYLAGKGNYALPPEKSLHVAGLAVDLPGNINDPATPRGWIRAHGFDHGWTAVANEPWHHEYNPTLDNRMEDDMTPELAARLEQIVSWMDGRFNQLAAWTRADANALKAVVAQMDPQAIADAIPADIADAVIAKLKERL